MLFYGDATNHEPSLMSEPLHVWRRMTQAQGGQVVESIAAFAQPGGVTVRKVYEDLRDQLLADLTAAGPVDIVLLNMHGAMVADGYDDCEGDALQKVRAMVGPDVVVGVELDLHCSLTGLMVDMADVIITFKEYPHIDAAARAEEVFNLSFQTQQAHIKPVMAVVDTHMINLWRTPVEPMRSMVAKMQAMEGKDGILSVSFAHGFPWQDVAETSAKMLVISDGNLTQAQQTARDFGEQLWQLRHECVQKTRSISEALLQLEMQPVAGQGAKPLVLADVADNAGGGAASDSTFILRSLIEGGHKDLLIGYFWDPLAVWICEEAGEGATLDLRVGGKCGLTSGDPVDLQVTVRRILPKAQQVFGSSFANMGTAVWLTADNGLDIVLNNNRCQVFHPSGFEQLGIDLSIKRAIVVKSMQHFYAGFAPIASEVIYVSCPGAVVPDFANIPYRNFTAPYWPQVNNPFSS